jgi:5-methyltetrahydrofolate--homocysteine methyltransferase
MTKLDITQLADIVVKGDVTAGISLTEKLLKARNTPDRIIEDGLLPGLTTVGDKYENEEFFLPELFSAGEVAKEVLTLLDPHIKRGQAMQKGTIVMGTVHRDVHDIGMNLVAVTLQGAGYQVINLGSDVSADEFVEAIKRNNGRVLGMSALITPTMPYMKTVIDALEESGLRERVKVIVGGAPLDDAYARKIGADAYGKDARDGLRKVEELLPKKGGV